MSQSLGKIYAITPQPPVPENTRWFSAGNLTIGVEYRNLDPEGLIASYEHDPAMQADLMERSPEGGFTDEGVSIHVSAVDDGHEYLRFDVFDGGPHYHYNHSGPEVINNVVEYDPVANGDMLEWVLSCLRNRLPEMFAEAGGSALVDHLNMDAINGAVDDVAELARRARRARTAT